ncbi:hypothetical protein [Flavisphingomonas formosensis]|uniref:hypothetical protein n=1 Tax=Flavisphingomonas formosensis TaxID=861534 RepID=UPI0012FA48C2|nr:hypothetical protein [Sphingomonas formosensis]
MPPPRTAAHAAVPHAPVPDAPTPRGQSAPLAGVPPELVHSILGSRTGVALPMFPVDREAIMRAAANAGAGNAAIARLAARMMPPPGAAALPETDAKPAKGTAETPIKPSAGTAGASEEAGGAKPARPPADQPEGVKGSVGKGAAGKGGAPPGGAAPIIEPNAAAGPQAVQQAAAQTAGAMPQPPASTVDAPAPPARRQPTPAHRVQAMAGPPPVPMATPAYANIPDPIPEATKKIEEAANSKLPDVVFPPVTISPGGHVPQINAKPLTKEQRRLVLVGEEGMNTANLPETERQKIRDARAAMLAPPELGEDGKPVPVVLPVAEPIKLKPLPPAVLTVAQRDLFTAALAQLLVDPAGEAHGILDTLKENSDTFPGRVLVNPNFEKVFKPMGEAKLGEIKQDLRAAVNPVADAMGVAGKILDDAVADRKAALEKERLEAQDKLKNGENACRQAVADNADARNADAAKAQAVAADAKQRAAAAKKKPKPTFRETADAAAARIKDKVAEAIAGFQLMETERGKKLDDARRQQLEAYQDAVTADQLAASVANKAAPYDQPFTAAAEGKRARERMSAAINAAKAWAEERRKLLDGEVKRLKDEAAAQTKANITAVQDEGAAAFRALKAWGDTQDGAVESWWADSAKNLESWAGAAHDTATTWAQVQSKLARLQMQRDLEAISEGLEAKLATEGADAAKFAALPEEQRKRFVDKLVSDKDNRAGIGAGLAASMRQRVVEVDKPKVEAALEAEALALPTSEWKAMEALVQSKDSGFHADKRSDTIFKNGEDKIGTDEDAIYGALSGISPLGIAAVKAHYFETHGHTLDWALNDEMSGDELRRAENLLKGDKGAAAAEAIHDAVWGPGTNEKQVMDALRGLTEDERKRAIAYYKDQYDQDLSTRLAEDMSGADLGQVQALLEGKEGEADAIAIDGGLRGHVFSPDRDSVTAVYDRVQQESMAKAKANNWTSAELDAEIERRNGEIEKRFGEKFSGVPEYAWGRGQSTLKTAITAAYPFDPANRKLVNALAENDMPTADAALMQTEREGVYADDSVLKGVVRKQYDRAFDRAQLDRGPELAQRVDNGMKAWMDEHVDRKTGKIIKSYTEEEKINQRMKLQRESDAMLQDEAFDRAKANSTVLDAVLQANHGITLDNMIAENMSWGDKRQAQSELRVMRTEIVGDTPQALKDAKRDRRRDWAYSRVRYAIEGVGTDMDELKGGIAGLDKEDLAYIDRKWRADHDNESFKEAVQSDTSGREEDDLVDTVEHGAALTVDQRMDEMRRKLKRDEDSVGPLGASGSRDASARSHRELAEMEALTADLKNPDLDPRKREFLSGELDRRIDHADAAIEAQRARVDAMADMLTTIAQYVIGAIAVILGAIVAVVSGGTALPALIAIAGSILGTLSGMAIKAAVKGGAYGSEEFLTDAVVGAVDLAVTIATLGTTKGSSLLTAAKTELKELGKASIRFGLKQAAKRTVATTVKEAAETAGKGSLTRRALTFIGKNAKEMAKNQAHQFVTALPTALVANVMNERNLRNGNAFHNIAHGTFDASIENLKVGAVMGAAGHVVQSGLGKVVHVENAPRSAVETRFADYKAWQESNPGKPRSDYVAQNESRAAAAAKDIDLARLETRAARKALFDALPPKERAGFADVEIVRVSEAEFKALNKGQTGDAMIFKKDGQTAIVIREGGQPSALRDLAPQVRQEIAPSSGGRTANAAEALPERLQNRVPIDVVNDPGLGRDGVRVVPMDPDGTIHGVRLEIGPEATAQQIREHVATIDGVRKFEGLIGRSRQAAIDVANALGADIISPRDRGRWEAAGEVKKLGPMIEDRVKQLAVETDPRRARALVDEINGLGRQFQEEHARLALGSAAEAKGYIAAKGTKKPRKGTAAVEDPKAARARKRAQKLQKDLGEGTARQKQLETERTQLSRPVDEIIDMLENRIAEMQETGANPQRLQEMLDTLAAGRRDEGLRKLGEWIGDKPPEQRRPGQEKSFADSLRETIAEAKRAEPKRKDREKALEAELDTVNKAIERTREKIGEGKYNRFAGDGRVPLHPSLPEPLAGRNYFPAPEPGKVLNSAELQALLNNQNGFMSELRLANRIAESGELVFQYGHKINEHGTDLASINPATGKVTLWDSKYHTVESTGHSDTFDVKGRRDAAVKDVLDRLNENPGVLPPDLRQKVIDAMSTETFDMVTSHTTGGSFTDRRIIFENRKEVGRD